MNATSYGELLAAVDELLSFANRIEPVPIEPTPDPDNPGFVFLPHPGAVRLADAQEAAYLAREHRAVTLAESCGLSKHCPTSGPINDWSQTGFSDRPTWLSIGNFEADRSSWNHGMRRFRAMVAELAHAPADDLQPQEVTAGAGGDDEQPQDAGDGELPECLVTLQQAAAMVNRSKRTVEDWKGKKGFPRPKVIGGGGKPHEYAWSELRPVLEKLSGRKLPERFPAQRFRPT
jgi:hypothetical protein